MENKILNEIAEFARDRLTDEFGYCGVAEGARVVILNSEDENGNDIKIKIDIDF